MSNGSPMSIPAYIATVFTPSILFTFTSIPVKKRNALQELVLFVLWFTGLSIPIYYAGQFPYLCLMSTSVWAWATSMKMGVWLFSMSMEERRARAFVFTLGDWRSRTIPAPAQKPKPDEYIQPPLMPLLLQCGKHLLIFDVIDFIFNWNDALLPVKVFSALLSKIHMFLGQAERAAVLAPAEPLTLSQILVSIAMSMLFCVYIQMQLQVTYDSILISFASVYKILPYLEKWQLGKDSKKLNTKNIAKTKAILRRVRWIRDLKSYIEDSLTMQPLFDQPWFAMSLRDFWGKRWHTFYNDCFYRLGYRPIRWIMMTIFDCKPPRWLPALAVFVMSGLMHEYFLYAATGSSIYFASPLAACGLQFLFFVVQVMFISIGDTIFSRGILGRLFTVFTMAVTCHFFVVPYVLTGYIYMERFSFNRMFVNIYNGDPNVFASIF
jgi:hypothetical protein